MVLTKGLTDNISKFLMSSKELFLILFLIPTIAIIVHIDFSALNLVYFIATEMILAHMIYGGYVVIREQERASLLSYGLAFAVWLCLLILFGRWVDNDTQWFIALMVIFAIALIFHFYSKSITRKKNLKDFCKYKMRIEFFGILLGWIGIILTKLFQQDMLFGIMNIIIIIIVNYFIFFKKKAYKKLNVSTKNV